MWWPQQRNQSGFCLQHTSSGRGLQRGEKSPFSALKHPRGSRISANLGGAQQVKASSRQKQHGLRHVSSILMPWGNRSGFSLLKTKQQGRERCWDKHPGHGERNVSTGEQSSKESGKALCSQLDPQHCFGHEGRGAGCVLGVKLWTGAGHPAWTPGKLLKPSRKLASVFQRPRQAQPCEHHGAAQQFRTQDVTHFHRPGSQRHGQTLKTTATTGSRVPEAHGLLGAANLPEQSAAIREQGRGRLCRGMLLLRAPNPDVEPVCILRSPSPVMRGRGDLYKRCPWCWRLQNPRSLKRNMKPTSKSCSFLLDNIRSLDQRLRPRKSSTGRENKIASSRAFLAAENKLLV